MHGSVIFGYEILSFLICLPSN